MRRLQDSLKLAGQTPLEDSDPKKDRNRNGHNDGSNREKRYYRDLKEQETETVAEYTKVESYKDGIVNNPNHGVFSAAFGKDTVARGYNRAFHSEKSEITVKVGPGLSLGIKFQAVGNYIEITAINVNKS
ncbi:hypothetical protein L4D15_24185 [Enterovibrio norvegicus]|uniref:hypothetical protein n=1 Tax=Enterovibrio norvegicus TaxID=188144 RepID=UPI003D0DEF87